MVCRRYKQPRLNHTLSTNFGCNKVVPSSFLGQNYMKLSTAIQPNRSQSQLWPPNRGRLKANYCLEYHFANFLQRKKTAAAQPGPEGGEPHGILEGISSLHSWIKTQTMIRPNQRGGRGGKQGAIYDEVRTVLRHFFTRGFHKILFSDLLLPLDMPMGTYREPISNLFATHILHICCLPAA